jgi:hypothetical protein
MTISAALMAALLAAQGQAPTPARPADAFVDAIGVNIHVHYNDTVYGNFARLKAALLDLGVRRFRDGLVDSTWTPYYDRCSELGRAGLKGLFIASAPPDRVLAAALKVKDALEAFEGPNEVNLNKWTPEAARDYQKKLWETIKKSPDFKDRPVILLSYTDYEWAKKLGDLSAFADSGNIHPYPGGWEPENRNDWMKADLPTGIAGARLVSGAKPITVTETGYTNHTSPGGHIAVSPNAAGIYLPRIFLNNLRSGIARTYWYELFDLKNDPKDVECNFGLYKNDGVTPKPAARALKRLIELLKDPGPPFPPGSLDFTVSDPKVQTMLFQKRTGEFLLALWLPSSLWDHSRPYGQKKEEDPPDLPVTVTIRGAASVTVHRNLHGEMTSETAATPSSLNLTVSESVTFLRIGRAR